MSLAPRVAAPRRLSVAIVARDAQNLLADTLTTARALADEIVIVDCGPNNRAVELARAHGAVLIARAWEHSFAAARNAALDRITGEFVLWLEPGETLTADSAAALRQFVLTAASPQHAYLLSIAVPPAPGNISGEQVARIRLQPTGRGLRYQGRVRERLQPSAEAAGLQVEALPWRILRGPRENDSQFKLDRARRNLELVQLDLAERGPRPCLALVRGEALSALGEQQAAAAAFREAVQLAPATSSVLREAYYGLLTTYDKLPSARPMQVDVCLEALEKFPLDAQLLCAMGGYLQAQGRIDLSARAYRTAVEFGQVDVETWHVPDIHEIAAVCLSLTYQLRHDDEGGRQALEESLSRRPDSPRVRRHLIDLHVRTGRRKEALEQFDQLPLDIPHREPLRSAIRGACLSVEQNWVPALAYLQTAYAAGCRDVLCLRWLASTLLATGQHDAALPILRQWEALDPRGTESQKLLVQCLPLPAPPAAQPAAPVADSESRRLRVDAGNSPSVRVLPIPRLIHGPQAHSSLPAGQ